MVKILCTREMNQGLDVNSTPIRKIGRPRKLIPTKYIFFPLQGEDWNVRTWPVQPRNDPDPEMIPTRKFSSFFSLSTPKWSPRNQGILIKHGTVDCLKIGDIFKNATHLEKWITLKEICDTWKEVPLDKLVTLEKIGTQWTLKWLHVTSLWGRFRVRCPHYRGSVL